MKYEVVLTDGAARQLDEACAWYVQNASHVANDWYNGFLDALNSLEENPERFCVATISFPGWRQLEVPVDDCVA